MSKIKISVIGTGHLGSIHLKLWKVNPNVEIAGIYDVDQDRAKKISNDLQVKSFDSIGEALDNCNAATISIPTSGHYELAKLCIERGIHCFIEKPVTATYAEALELIELSKQKNVLLQVGHVERFNPALLALRDYNLAPRFIEAHRLSQFKPRATDVSVVHDLMIHDIDIVLWLVKSQVDRIDANGVAVITDTPDIANARITFKNGAVANLTSSRISTNPMRKLRIFQQNAYISIDFGNQNVDVFRLIENDNPSQGDSPANILGSMDAGIGNKKIILEKPIVPEINAIAEEQNSFVDSIMNGKPVAVTVEEAAEALRIAEMIMKQM